MCPRQIHGLQSKPLFSNYGVLAEHLDRLAIKIFSLFYFQAFDYEQKKLLATKGMCYVNDLYLDFFFPQETHKNFLSVRIELRNWTFTKRNLECLGSSCTNFVEDECILLNRLALDQLRNNVAFFNLLLLCIRYFMKIF